MNSGSIFRIERAHLDHLDTGKPKTFPNTVAGQFYGALLKLRVQPESVAKKFQT